MFVMFDILNYPKIEKETTTQSTQNRCIGFCLQLHKVAHIYYLDFKRLNWLSMTEKLNQNKFQIKDRIHKLNVSSIKLAWTKFLFLY